MVKVVFLCQQETAAAAPPPSEAEAVAAAEEAVAQKAEVHMKEKKVWKNAQAAEQVGLLMIHQTPCL